MRCGFSLFFFSSRRRHTRLQGDWSSDVCSSDLVGVDEVVRCAVVDEERQHRLGALRAAGGVVFLQRDVLAEVHEIGRASCRGRGEISVVAVSLKKKKKMIAIIELSDIGIEYLRD